MSSEFGKVLEAQTRQRARVSYIEAKADSFVFLFYTTPQKQEALASAIDLAGRLFDMLPRMPTEDDAVSKPSTPASNHCPKCDSPDPGRHPAMQAGGEVQICSHPFHGAGR